MTGTITMRRKTVLSVGISAVLIVAAVLTAGCISEEEDEWDGVIRVAYLQGDIHQVAFFVAKNPDVGGGESLFDQYDVEVEEAAGAPYSNGGAVMTAFSAGDVDIGYLGSPPAITGHVNGEIKTRVVAQVNALGSALVVREGIDTVQDLDGAKIATPGGATIQHFMLLTYLEDNGLDPSDVEITSESVTLMRASLESGAIDGFIAWQPFPADAVVNGAGHVLANSSDIWPGHICCVVATMQSFAKDHPDAVTGFLRAHVAATKWMQQAMADNTSEEYSLLVNISVDFTGRPDEVVIQALATMEYNYVLDQTFLDAFEAYVDKLISQGTLLSDKMDKAGYADAQELTDTYVDDTFIKEAETSL
jgi:NitT/TauT family transport system substrate-binding protein